MARALSEEIIKKIQELINKGDGDPERLHTILHSLQDGNPLELSDKQYVESFFSESSGFEKNEKPVSVDDSSTRPNNEPSFNNTAPSVVSKAPKGNRKKIAMAGIIIAVIFFSYVGANSYAVSSLQIRPHQGNQYAISETVLHIQAEACNPSYFPASFHSYEISAIYKSKVIETASIDGSTVSPKSSLLLNGTFTIDKEMLSEVSKLGSDFDPSQAKVKTKLDAPILGFIPFTINKDYSGTEFADIVKNGPPSGYTC